MKKNYVLDTNVLLHDPKSIFRFEDNHVVIPIYVIEEIDQFKREASERGRNARAVTRHLDELRERGPLATGVSLDGGGRLTVAVPAKRPELPSAIDKTAMDAAVWLLDSGVPPESISWVVPRDSWLLNRLQTQPLLYEITRNKFDAAFGGARRDEDKARAKERILSFRDAFGQWDPKNQRPELWNLYNAKKTKGESIRVFPISNWTELDIWQYIALEKIDIVPLYFSKPRPTVERDGMILVVDDDRFRLEPGEEPVTRSVRFRTLGCYPLTGATESDATEMNHIIQEMLLATGSERQGRAIDKGQSASMEDKKQEGYF
jgi:sulfate adenylyltransferase small subunit